MVLCLCAVAISIPCRTFLTVALSFQFCDNKRENLLMADELQPGSLQLNLDVGSKPIVSSELSIKGLLWEGEAVLIKFYFLQTISGLALHGLFILQWKALSLSRTPRAHCHGNGTQAKPFQGLSPTTPSGFARIKFLLIIPREEKIKSVKCQTRRS